MVYGVLAWPIWKFVISDLKKWVDLGREDMSGQVVGSKGKHTGPACEVQLHDGSVVSC